MAKRMMLVLVCAVGLVSASGCCIPMGDDACDERQACCDAIESAPSSGTVAYIRGACRVRLTASRLCESSLDNIHDRISRSPGDTVPQACQP